MASRAAVRAFHDAPLARPRELVDQVHRALRGTRGAAVAIVQRRGDTLLHAGVGNVVGNLHGARSRSLLSNPGIAGSHVSALQETSYPLGPDDVVTLASDGLTDRIGMAPYPGLAGRSPLVVAGVLLRDFGVRRDDACVAVLPPRGTP